MIVSLFSIFLAGCSISTSSPSPNSQEAQIRLKSEELQTKIQTLYELSHQLESDIDEIRRNSKPDSEEAVQKLEQHVKDIRREQTTLKEEFKAWKLQLIPKNSNE